MSEDPAGHDLPTPDTSGQAQQVPPPPFTMTVEEAVLRYAQLGHPRNPRSVRRFCHQGTLDCRKVRTSNFSEAYLIDSNSVDRHAKEIAETFSFTSKGIAAHDLPSPDKSGHDLPGPDTKFEFHGDARYVALLEKVNGDQVEQLKTKDEQLKIKDTQIAAMLERDKETNFLIRGLQTLLGLPDRREPPVTHDIQKEKSVSPAP